MHYCQFRSTKNCLAAIVHAHVCVSTPLEEASCACTHFSMVLLIFLIVMRSERAFSFSTCSCLARSWCRLTSTSRDSILRRGGGGGGGDSEVSTSGVLTCTQLAVWHHTRTTSIVHVHVSYYHVYCKFSFLNYVANNRGPPSNHTGNVMQLPQTRYLLWTLSS